MTPARVALDLLGGDGPPQTVVSGALSAAAADPDLEVILVGPPELARATLTALGAEPDALPVVAASQVVGMAEDPARAVRSKRDATVRVASRLVRDGRADAVVSIGSTGAALAAAVFSLGRIPGVTRPGLAVVVPAPLGPVVLLDVGATSDATPDQLVQLALAGAALAQAALGLPSPRVGLLTIGEEPGKGDQLRREAWPLISQALERGPVRFVGSVEGSDVALGGAADVIVTDGFTGNVVLKAVEGTVRALAAVVPAVRDAGRQWGADRGGGAVLLGVPAVVVVGHGASGSPAVAACVAQAARAVREGLVPRLSAALADLVLRRRADAGLAGSDRDRPQP